jgi:hypothetical protein
MSSYSNRGSGGGGASISQLTWNSGTETLKLAEDGVDIWTVQQDSAAGQNEMILRGANGTGGVIFAAVQANGVVMSNRNATNINMQLANTIASVSFGSYSMSIDATGWHANIGGADALSVDANRNVRVGAAALATTATAGFLMIPTCPGVPTGVVAVPAGLAAIVFNSTANALYGDDGGGWGAL